MHTYAKVRVLGFCQIQKVIDLKYQRFRSLQRGLQMLSRTFVKHFFERHFQIIDDSVEWRPD